MKKRILWGIVDIAAAAVIILAVWIGNYLIPQKGIAAASIENVMTATETAGEIRTGDLNGRQEALKRTKVVLDKQDWHKKFADKFTDTVVSTDTSYTSPNVSVQLSFHEYDTGKLDKSDKGKHIKYGTQISYVLADIYVGDITCLQTAFAQDTYGVGYSEKLLGMSERMKSILAVNGDSYSNNRHKNNGTIIRNGVIYRNKQTKAETCVLNWDGTMDIYGPEAVDLRQLVEKGAYQSWIFGPSLLDENGKAKEKFWTWNYIRQSHPRTAIGYFEPGHYCLLLVDGRQESSRGMFLSEMAKVFEDLGCAAAQEEEEYLESGAIRIHKTFNEVYVNQELKDLTDIEYNILLLMMKYPLKIFSAQNLYESVWSEPYFYSCNSTVMVHIRRLRVKLETDPKNPKYIKTVWGKGYKFDAGNE